MIKPRHRLWYWGDADPEGIRIPTAAAVTAQQAGLPSLDPHPHLWASYADMPVRAAGKLDWSGVPTAWLGERLSGCVDAPRSAAGRIAQEALGYPEIAAALG